MLKNHLVQLLCFIDEETEAHKCYVISPKPQSPPEAEPGLKLAGFTNFGANETLCSLIKSAPKRCVVTSLSKWKLVLKRQELIYCLVQTGKYID